MKIQLALIMLSLSLPVTAKVEKPVYFDVDSGGVSKPVSGDAFGFDGSTEIGKKIRAQEIEMEHEAKKKNQSFLSRFPEMTLTGGRQQVDKPALKSTIRMAKADKDIEPKVEEKKADKPQSDRGPLIRHEVELGSLSFQREDEKKQILKAFHQLEPKGDQQMVVQPFSWVDSTADKEEVDKKKAVSDAKDDMNVTKIFPGDTFLGQMENQINSDYPGSVLVKIIQGPLRGARLVGSFQRHNEKVAIQFQQMIFKKTAFKVQAHALDVESFESHMADEVDNHIFERYAGFMVANLLDGVRGTLDGRGTTVISNDAIINNKKRLNVAETTLSALGKVGEQISPHLANKLNMPPTVKLDLGTPVGVFFDEVLEVDAALTKKQWNRR